MPTVSIMIMSHDNRELLQECLLRIRSTTPKEFEIIIVDDASTPAYTNEEFPDTILVRMPRRSNCCNLRNVGMEMAKTEYVLWLDNDTMVEEGWYQPLLEKALTDPRIGLVGQPMDSRLIRKPFFPLTQAECMVEYQFAYDYNHLTSECDFITSYCILVKKEAYRPTYCYNMPTPVLDPDLGAGIKANGYRVVVSDKNLPVKHIGSSTPRPYGLNYHFYLSRNFTRWFRFWEPQADKVFELYKGIDVQYNHNENEPMRNGSRGVHQAKDTDFEDIPAQYHYDES